MVEAASQQTLLLPPQCKIGPDLTEIQSLMAI